MKKLLLLILLVSPAFGQTFSGTAGSDIFIPSPFRFCWGVDGHGDNCSIQSANQETQWTGSLDFKWAFRTVGTLPAASAMNLGRTYEVTDGQSNTDCTTGGGSALAICTSNGSTWNAIAASGGGGGSGGVPNTLPNCTATGTTLNEGVSFSTQVINTVTTLCAQTSATSSNVVVGIATSGAGTSGAVAIAYSGYANCLFDNQTTQGDYVVASATNAGQCSDIGASKPSGTVETIGIVASTNTGGGTLANVLVNPLSLYTPGGTNNSGNINTAAQFKVPYYSAGGNANVLSGDSNCTLTSGFLTGCLGISIGNGGSTGVITYGIGTAPSNPASGSALTYIDSTSNLFTCITSTGATCLAGVQNEAIFTPAFGVKADGRMVWDATFTNTSKTVTCPNSDCNFTSADVGKIVFGTNVTPGGYTSQIISTAILPQGTITSINNANSIQVSNAATANSGAAAGVLIWGSDDTTALNNAWAATLTTCSTLRLPGINPINTGPAIMLVSGPVFNTLPATQGNGDNSNCSLGSEGNRRGLTIIGSGINSTYIIPVPNFNFSGCTYGQSGAACMFTVADGLNLQNFTMWGGGVSNPNSPGNANALYVTEINSMAHFVAGLTAGNNSLQNVTFMGWGAGATGFKACVKFDGGVTGVYFLTIDGCGITGAQVDGLQIFHDVAFFDNYENNLYISSTGSVNSLGSYYCCVGQGGGGDSMVADLGYLFSNGDSYGALGAGQSNANALNGSMALSIGYRAGIFNTTGTGVAYVNNATMAVTGNAGSGQGIFVCGTQGSTCPGQSTLYLSNSTVTINNSRPPINIYGNYFDQGGNTFVGTPSVAGTGKVFGSSSITGTTLATVVATSNWGASPSVGSLAGNSIDGQFTVTVSTGPGANPVATVTFPTTFLLAPTCFAVQIGGTQAQAFVQVGSVTATTLPLTWVGTPSNGNTVQIHYHCWN